MYRGLSKDFRTAGLGQRQFQNDSSNQFWELVFTPLANLEVTQFSAKKKKECNTMEAPLIGATNAFKVTRINTFRKQYKNIY